MGFESIKVECNPKTSILFFFFGLVRGGRWDSSPYIHNHLKLKFKLLFLIVLLSILNFIKSVPVVFVCSSLSTQFVITICGILNK